MKGMPEPFVVAPAKVKPGPKGPRPAITEIRRTHTGFIVNRRWFKTEAEATEYRDQCVADLVDKRTVKGSLTETGSWVYFIRAIDGGPIKIGTAQNVKGRLEDLQVAHWQNLVVLGVSPEHGDLEFQLHSAFRQDRIRGEWFRDTEELRAVMHKLCDKWTEASLDHVKVIWDAENLPEFTGKKRDAA